MYINFGFISDSFDVDDENVFFGRTTTPAADSHALTVMPPIRTTAVSTAHQKPTGGKVTLSPVLPTISPVSLVLPASSPASPSILPPSHPTHLLLILPTPDSETDNYTFYVRQLADGSTQPLYVVTGDSDNSSVSVVFVDSRPLSELLAVQVTLDIDGEHHIALRLHLTAGLHHLTRQRADAISDVVPHKETLNTSLPRGRSGSLALARIVTVHTNTSDSDLGSGRSEEARRGHRHHEPAASAVIAIALSLLSALVLVIVCISGFMASEYYRRYDLRSSDYTYSEGRCSVTLTDIDKLVTCMYMLNRSI